MEIVTLSRKNGILDDTKVEMEQFEKKNQKSNVDFVKVAVRHWINGHCQLSSHFS